MNNATYDKVDLQESELDNVNDGIEGVLMLFDKLNLNQVEILYVASNLLMHIIASVNGSRNFDTKDGEIIFQHEYPTDNEKKVIKLDMYVDSTDKTFN